MLSDLYRRMVELSADGLWVLDTEGRTEFVNRRLADMLGVAREDLADSSPADFLDDAGRQQWRDHVTQVALEGANRLPVDCRFVRADGVAVWFLVSESTLHDDDGTPTGLLLSLSDYDDRRRLQTELADSRRGLIEAQRIARMGSWSWSLDTDVLEFSPALRDLIVGGCPPSMTGPDALATLSVAERERLAPLIARTHAGDADSACFDVATTTPDGDTQWLRVRAVVHRDADGVPLTVTGTTQDVTETRQTERALEVLADENQLMQRIAIAANESQTLGEVLTVAAGLVVEHANWCRARTFEPDQDLTEWPLSFGVPDDGLADPSLPERERATARRAVAAGGPVWDDVERLTVACPIRAHGRTVAVIVMTSEPPVRDRDTTTTMVRQVVGQLSAVAERQETAVELASARDAAEAASRHKSEFLATMSHEIRTPLNGVIGLNDLLRATDLDAHQQRLVSGVAVSGRALLGIVDDILDFSKIEAGQLELETIDVDVRQVLDDLAAMTAETAAARSVELVMHCDRDVPGTLRGDRVRLSQVISNLVSNAVKFTQDGEVRVRVGLGGDPDTPSDAHLLVIEVEDSGVGISPERVTGIFEPFIQADASTTREFGGTGLGLAIVREIVTALGGEIAVSSRLGEGSTFRCTVRMQPAPAGAPDLAAPLAGRRVLVADARAPRSAADVERLAHWGAVVLEEAPTDVASRLRRAAEEGVPVDLVLLSSDSPDPAPVPGSVEGVPVVCLQAGGPSADAAPGAACVERPVSGARLLEAIGSVLGHDGSSRSAPRSSAAAPPAGPVDVPATDAGRGRVLVVEDTPLNQLVAEGILTALGYESESVADGVGALERLAGGADGFDLVLMDVQMPRLDGYATSRRIREREAATGARRLPIVAMTASAVIGERERCLDAGMDDFLTKPVSPARLATVLADHVAPRTVEGAPGGPAVTPTLAPPVAALDVDPVVPSELRAHLDLERLEMLRDLDPGNTAYLDRVIGNFTTRTPGLAEAIADAVETGDPAAVTSTAHRLRGSALNLGVPQVAEVALALETLGDTGDLDGAAALLDGLGIALEHGRAAVRAYQASYGGA